MDISHLERGAPIGLDALTSQSPDPQGFERLAQWLGSDQRELDPTELDTEFHTNTKILLDDEKVLMAFKAGRDVTLFTNKRIMMIDVQGLIGHKIEYTSIPYRSIHAYSVQSAGVVSHHVPERRPFSRSSKRFLAEPHTALSHFFLFHLVVGP